MIVFHGGAVAIPIPDLLHSRKAVDFGPGFYVTPIREQAIRWSEKRKRRGGKAVVSRYDFDETAIAGLKTLRFDSYSEAWLDFIVACRRLQDESDWDIVVGGVANDKVFDTLEAFSMDLPPRIKQLAGCGWRLRIFKSAFGAQRRFDRCLMSGVNRHDGQQEPSTNEVRSHY